MPQSANSLGFDQLRRWLWVSAKWNPKSHFDLHLGYKGIFIVIFSRIEDKNRVIDEAPYFFNSVGLYIRNCFERLNTTTKDYKWDRVWICLYSLPREYWDEETLQDIGNSIKYFFKIVDQTKTNKYTSYARICVYMHIARALSDSVCLAHENSEWITSMFPVAVKNVMNMGTSTDTALKTSLC